MKKLLAYFLLVIFLASCAPAAAISPTAVPPTPPAATQVPAIEVTDWWQTAVFYEIFVRSFNDSNGDGIGDFNGITQKLDYLQQLGVTAIWLMPIHPSPSYHGYDVINYYAVNPQYGTMADFKNLLSEAHKRDMRIIIDLVLNHTSAQHPWFVDANNNPQSPYRNWYIWSDSPEGKYWYPGKTSNYFAIFWGGMPDLNYNNPELTAQMEKMTTFWLKDIGVDGFRMDAAKHLIEADGKIENTPETHTWLNNFYTFYKSVNPQAYVVGEVYGAGGLIAKTYKDQLDGVFNFELASGFVNSANGGSNSGINSGIKLTLPKIADGSYATFLTNHDQNRLMSVLDGNVDKAKVAASLMLTAQGTPFIYYGEEIGMIGKKPDEDIRLPMQWSADPVTAGFTSGTPWRTPAVNTATSNVDSETTDPSSLLNHYKALINLRNLYPALQTGSWSLVDTSVPAIYASFRVQGDEIILVLVNLSKEKITDYKLSAEKLPIPEGTYQLETVFGTGSASELQVSGSKISSYQPFPVLEPYSTLICILKLIP